MRYILTIVFILSQSISLLAQVGSTCSNPYILSLPFSGSSMTTVGFGDNYDENSACGSDYMNGNDYVITYTPAADECVTFNLSNTTSKYNRGMFLLDGCPDSGATCIASDQGSFISPSGGFTDVNLTGGQTYYLIISSDVWATGGVQTITFDLDITGGPCPTCTDGIRNGDEENIDCGGSCPNACEGKTCASAVEISSLPFKALDNTTDNMLNSYNSYGCSGGTGWNGEDYIYKYTATAADTCVTIALEDLRTVNINAFLYIGCPDTGTCVSTSTHTVSAPHQAVYIENILLTAGTEYYIVIDGTSGDNDFDFSMGNYCTAPECGSDNDPANDFCSSATILDNIEGFCGTTSSVYTESPADDPDEVSDEFCATIENNSWYVFTASETSAVINVYVYDCVGSSIEGIQMVIYETSDCNSYNPVSNCWNPGIMTNGTVQASGLVVGNDYYIMVDGNGGEVCNYTIEAESGVALSSTSVGNFEAVCENNETTVKWTVTELENNVKMTLMGSEDGNDFESIGTMMHNGNNKKYSFKDSNSKGSNYYKIKVENTFGNISYTRTIYGGCKSLFDDLSIYPNPAKDIITIKGEGVEDLEISLFNPLGQQISIYTTVQKNEVQMNVRDLERGVYFLNIKFEDQIINKRIVLN